jgi:hypothetical protein
MNLWDLAASLSVDPLYLFEAWVRGCPIVDFQITSVAWNAWHAANPF